MIVNHISSRDTPESERLAAWRDFLGRKFLRTHIEPVPDRHFLIEATLHRLAGISVVSSFSSGAVSRRSRDLLDGDDQVVLNIVRDGACVVTQRGEEAVCQAGEAILMSATEPCTVLRPADTRVLSVSLPRRALTPYIADAQAAVMRRVQAGSSMLKLLTHYLDAMPTALLQSNAEAEKAFVGHIYELTALAVSGRENPTVDVGLTGGDGLRAARLQAAQRHIEGNLHEPDLSPARVAVAIGISVRQLHLLFEAQGTSVMRYVLARRLDHAARLITSRVGTRLSITDIAFHSGFDSLSTFYRAFKRAHGLSPVDYRANHLDG